MALLRWIACAVLVLALLPATAHGLTFVSVDDNGIIEVRDAEIPTTADDLTLSAVGNEYVITSDNEGLSEVDPCTGNASEVRCPAGTSITFDLAGSDDQLINNGVAAPIAVDLGEGTDSYTASGPGASASIAGGIGNDTITGGASAEVLAGGDGNDMLTGGGGVDDYFGEADNDTIQARDGNAERIACGAGTDVVTNDFTDIIAECETGVDTDGDGFGSAVDCNDTVARIFPGATEVFENGIDEDCNGRDDVNLDRDGDGFIRPVDCDDGNRNVRPNAPEVRGNARDENCDNRAAPFAELATVVSNRWVVASGFTVLRSLVVRNAPAGTRIALRCEGGGCPIERARRRTVRRNLARIVLHRGFKKARLQPGARLRLSITAAETIGRTYSYTIKRSALPDSRITCRAPDARRGRAC